MKATTKRKSVEPSALLQDGQDTPSKKGRPDTPKGMASRTVQAIDKTSEKQRSLFERWCSGAKSTLLDAPKVAPLPEEPTGQTEAVSERRSNEVIAVISDESASRGGHSAPITIEDSEVEGSRKHGVEHPLQPVEASTDNTSKTEPTKASDLATKPADVSVTLDLTHTEDCEKDANANMKPAVVKKPVRRPRKPKAPKNATPSSNTSAVEAGAALNTSANPTAETNANSSVNPPANVEANAASKDTSAKTPKKRGRKPTKKGQNGATDPQSVNTSVAVVASPDVPAKPGIAPSAEAAEAIASADVPQADSEIKETKTDEAATSAEDKEKRPLGRPRKSSTSEADPKSVAKAAAVQQMSSFMKRFFVQAESGEKPARAELKEDETSRAQSINETAVDRFKPFQLKRGMRIAPTWRVDPASINRSLLDSFLESAPSNTAQSQLYLAQLRTGAFTPRHCGPTWPLDYGCGPLSSSKPEEAEAEIDNESDVELVNDNECDKSAVFVTDEPPCSAAGLETGRNQPKCKLLQFHDNYRPAYFGTLRKRSSQVRPRRPLAKDSALNYEVDSDEEWGCEPEGESVSSSSEAPADAPDEKAERSEDYELDDFFVPHGYLSADEQHDSEQEAAADRAGDGEGEGEGEGENGPDVTPAMRKAVQQVTARQMAAQQRRAATRALRPLLVGCLYFTDRNEALAKLDAVSDRLRRVFVPLAKSQMAFGTCSAIHFFEPAAYEAERKERAAKQRPQAEPDATPHKRRSEPATPLDATPQQRLSAFPLDKALYSGRLVPFPDAAMPYLVKMLHGSERSLAKMVTDFRLFWLYRSFSATQSSAEKEGEEKTAESQPLLLSKRQIELKANMIATYARASDARKRCWAVTESVRNAHAGFEQLDLSVPPQFTALFTERLNALQGTPRQKTQSGSASPSTPASVPKPQTTPSPSPSLITVSTLDANAVQSAITPARVVLQNLKRRSMPPVPASPAQTNQTTQLTAPSITTPSPKPRRVLLTAVASPANACAPQLTNSERKSQ